MEVYSLRVDRALLRLGLRRVLHREVACQAGRSRRVAALARLRHDAHAHRSQLKVVYLRAQFRESCRDLALVCSPERQSVQVSGPGQICPFAADLVRTVMGIVEP